MPDVRCVDRAGRHRTDDGGTGARSRAPGRPARRDRRLVFSLPELVLGENQDASEHSARHLGAFTVAYAVGLLVVVVRPARARTMLPVAAVLAGALLVTAIADLGNGRVPLVDEAQHLPEFVSVVLVWLIAVPSSRRRGRAERRDRGRGELRVVQPDRRAG